MKKIDFGQSAQLLANLVVIAGIVFLALEINQNTAMLASQGRADLADRRTRFAEMLIANPELFDLAIRASEGQPLTRVEEQRLFVVGARRFSSWESQFLEFNAGLLPREDLRIESLRAIVRGQQGVDLHPKVTH